MGVARFFFHDLCEQPLAAPDYLRIAHEFHTLIVDRIPVMGFDQRNAAKRASSFRSIRCTTMR
jgi:cell division protein ZapE